MTAPDEAPTPPPPPPLPGGTDETVLRFFDPATLAFTRAGAALRLTVTGEFSCLQTAVLRMFPLTDPDCFFSIRDGAGRELGVLRSLAELDPDSRACVQEALARRYMAAQIRKIIRVRERFGVVEWEVETQRGGCRFSTRDLRENVRRLSERHLILADVEDNRYEVVDSTALDPHSQACLWRYL